MRNLQLTEMTQVSGGISDYGKTIQDNFFGINININQITPATWNDSSLGIHEDGGVYAMVITHGAVVSGTYYDIPVTFHISDAGAVKFAGFY